MSWGGWRTALRAESYITCFQKESAEPRWDILASQVAFTVFCLVFCQVSILFFCISESDCNMLSNTSGLGPSDYSFLTWTPGQPAKAGDQQTSCRQAPAWDVGSPSLTRGQARSSLGQNHPEGSSKQTSLPAALSMAGMPFTLKHKIQFMRYQNSTSVTISARLKPSRSTILW